MCGSRVFEETSAIISEIPGLENIENVKNVLESKKYTYRITTICDSERYYVTFVKQVPFDASIQRRYAHNMRMLYHAGRKQETEVPTPPLNEEERSFLSTHPAVRMNDEGRLFM